MRAFDSRLLHFFFIVFSFFFFELAVPSEAKPTISSHLAMAVTIKLFVFAHLRDKLSVDGEIQITLPKAEWPSSDELKLELLRTLHLNVDQGWHSSIMLALNEEFLYPDTRVCLKAGDVIALIPPVSGG